MLQPPPTGPAELEDLPQLPIGGSVLYRVWRADTLQPRTAPWWFASQTGAPGGRFDLAAPLGTLYTSTSRSGALLEALQALLTNLPIEELEVRRLAVIAVPDAARPAADLCDPTVAGRGATGALWAGTDRHLTQQWAAALRRDGWWAIHTGIQHDPSGSLRAVAVFGAAGDGAPTLGGKWTFTSRSLHDDQSIGDNLAAFGVEIRGPGELPFTDKLPR